MVEARAVQEMFALRNLGWCIKRIAKKTGIARNTVRDWLRKGPDRQYVGPQPKASRVVTIKGERYRLREKRKAGILGTASPAAT